MYADLPGARIHYEYTLHRGAPVVCLAHCFASDLHFWDTQMPVLDAYSVLRYDARGHGLSAKPPGPYTLEQMYGDVVALLDHLGIDGVHFCGVSMGGMTGQLLALAHPDRVASLGLVNTTCTYTPEQRALWRERASQAAERGVYSLKDDMLERWFTDGAATAGLPGYAYMSAALDRLDGGCFAASAEAVLAIDTRARLGEIRAPTMVVAAPEDPGVPRTVSVAMAQAIPDAELHWLEPARHLATLEHPQAFNQLLGAFLARVCR